MTVREVDRVFTELYLLRTAARAPFGLVPALIFHVDLSRTIKGHLDTLIQRSDGSDEIIDGFHHLCVGSRAEVYIGIEETDTLVERSPGIDKNRLEAVHRRFCGIFFVVVFTFSDHFQFDVVDDRRHQHVLYDIPGDGHFLRSFLLVVQVEQPRFAHFGGDDGKVHFQAVVLDGKHREVRFSFRVPFRFETLYHRSDMALHGLVFRNGPFPVQVLRCGEGMVQFAQQVEVVPLREISAQFRCQFRYIDGLCSYFGHISGREVRCRNPIESRFHVYAERPFFFRSGNSLCRRFIFRLFCQRIDTLLQCLYLGIQRSDTRFGNMVHGGVEKLLRISLGIIRREICFLQHARELFPIGIHYGCPFLGGQCYTTVVGKGKLRFTQHLGDELSHFDFRKEIFFHRKNING